MKTGHTNPPDMVQYRVCDHFGEHPQKPQQVRCLRWLPRSKQICEQSIFVTNRPSFVAASQPTMNPLAPLLRRTLVIVAHPDDETVACAALLQRIREPHVLFCTEAVPSTRSSGDATVHAKPTALRQKKPARPQSRRRREVEFSRARSGEPIIDQQLFQHLPEAMDSVSDVVSRVRPNALLTIAYEGGHPDHDSCSFITSL